jgi:2,5-furandicarboxylate decarboxylase 1
MEALFQVKGVKHITIVDDDIDVFDDDEITWAMATRFNADKDLFLPSRKLQAFYADPNADAEGLVSKVGFDLTSPTSKSKEIRFHRPRAPRIVPALTNSSVRQALESGPKYFGEILAAVGSNDGREVAIELDQLRESGELTRLDNGEYALASATPGRPRVT